MPFTHSKIKERLNPSRNQKRKHQVEDGILRSQIMLVSSEKVSPQVIPDSYYPKDRSAAETKEYHDMLDQQEASAKQEEQLFAEMEREIEKAGQHLKRTEEEYDEWTEQKKAKDASQDVNYETIEMERRAKEIEEAEKISKKYLQEYLKILRHERIVLETQSEARQNPEHEVEWTSSRDFRAPRRP